MNGLRVQHPLPGAAREEVGRRASAVRSGTLVRVRVTLSEELVLGDQVATQEGALEHVETSDAELEAGMRVLAAPYEVDVPALGTLDLDRIANGFRGEVRVGRRRAELFVPRGHHLDDIDRDRALLDDVSRRVVQLNARWSDVLGTAVAKMYPVYESTWASGSPVSRERFTQRVRVESLDVDEERITVYLDCADLFDDQAIEVRLDRSLAVTEVSLSG